MESKLREMIIEEEETSRQMHTNDAGNTKGQVKYNGTTGEGVEQATFLSYGETTAKYEANDSRTENATSREDDYFETRIVFETSSDEGTGIGKACLPKGDKKCKANKIEEIGTKKDIKSKVAMDDTMADGHVATFPTPILETSAVTPLCQRETGETEGGGGKTEAQHDKNGRQSTTKDDEGQTGQEDWKSVPWDDISTSNDKENSIKIVITLNGV